MKRRRMLLVFCGCALTLTWGRLSAENLIPKESPLRKEIKMEDKDDPIKAAILKLIPLGTSEADAKNLFKKHMPSKERDRHKLDGASIPEKLRGKKYTCFRLIEEIIWSQLGTQWVEVLFFFEEGRLMEVHVGRGAVTP